MRKKILVLLGAFISFSINSEVAAQTITPYVINTTGGTAFISNVKIDWNVGEMPLVATMQNGIVVTNGFLQPFTERPDDVNNNTAFSPTEIRVFPNPASSFVEVNFFTTQKGTMRMRLYNSMGQLVFQSQFTSNGVGHIERISVDHLANAEYILHIALDPDAGSVKKKGSYKIIKIQ